MPIYLSSTGCNFSESQNKIIDFKCKNLESAIRDKIDNPSNNICVSDVEHITELSLIGYEISDISPLSNLTNLKILYLENNELEDISAISQF
jgi:internalin A